MARYAEEELAGVDDTTLGAEAGGRAQRLRDQRVCTEDEGDEATGSERDQDRDITEVHSPVATKASIR